MAAEKGIRAGAGAQPADAGSYKNDSAELRRLRALCTDQERRLQGQASKIAEGHRLAGQHVDLSDPAAVRCYMNEWGSWAKAYDGSTGPSAAAPGAPQHVEDVIPPRPLGYNDASTDPTSPLQRWGKPRHEGAKLLLQPIADGYWTPWHIANDMLREAQRAAATAPAGGVTEADERAWFESHYASRYGKRPVTWNDATRMTSSPLDPLPAHMDGVYVMKEAREGWAAWRARAALATAARAAEPTRCKTCNGTGMKGVPSEQSWRHDGEECEQCDGTGFTAARAAEPEGEIEAYAMRMSWNDQSPDEQAHYLKVAKSAKATTSQGGRHADQA